mgnify:CR=1 FL=1
MRTACVDIGGTYIKTAVLEDGRLHACGTHEQLLEQKGQYYQLYTGAFELE